MTVGLGYDVRPGRAGDFEQLWAEVAGVLQGTDGHVASRLFRDVHRPDSYLILSEWSDREAFTAFTRSEAFRRVTERGAGELLAGPPRHRVYA